MFSRMPVAPSTLDSSSGEEIAARAASAARFSPDAVPMPISAVPDSRMTVRTSAKSRLISPGTVIRSVMPWTPWRRTSSAIAERLDDRGRRSTSSSSRSFGITSSVSTFAASSSMPRSAWSVRRRALERERLRDDADGERVELAARARRSRRRAGAGAAALAGRDEDHVGALQRLLQLVAALDRRLAADVGIRRRRRGRAVDLRADVQPSRRRRSSAAPGRRCSRR